MENKYKTLELYRNLFEERSSKGSFRILDGGSMYPQTKNKTCWGLASANFMPAHHKNNLNVVTPLREYSRPDDATQLSAFYKFQKSNFHVFAESVGMEIASRFRVPTCSNCPVILPPSETTLYSMVEGEKPDVIIGTLVFSFLNRNQSLHTFASITRNDTPVTNINDNYETIDRFIIDKNPGNYTAERMGAMALSAKQNLSYQFLLRDCFGDVDFTSKNSGLIYDPENDSISCAPHFDFGELMNLLYTSKVKELELDSLENYAENARPFIAPHIEAINAAKIAKHNAPTYSIAKMETMSDSQKNRDAICREYPEVAVAFLQDLQAFQQSGELPKIIEQYSGENDLVSTETGTMATEFLDWRMQIYTQQLLVDLSQSIGEEKLDEMLSQPVELVSIESFTKPLSPQPTVEDFAQ